jgi:hypothetical protein
LITIEILICPSVGEKSYLSVPEVVLALVENLSSTTSPLRDKYGKVVLKLHNFCFLQGMLALLPFPDLFFFSFLTSSPSPFSFSFGEKERKKGKNLKYYLDNDGETPHPLFTLTPQERKSAAVLKSHFTTADEEQYNILPFLASFDIVCAIWAIFGYQN